MNADMTANGLRLHTISSAVTVLPSMTNKTFASESDVQACVSAHLSGAAFFVAYLDYTVIIGRYEAGIFRSLEHEALLPKYLKRLRVFDAKQELLLWGSGETFQGRLRTDDQVGAPSVDVVDAHQVLFGTAAEAKGEFTTISEERGISLTLPFPNIIADDHTKRAYLKTRNYVETIKNTGQATYTDCRFVGFRNGEKDLTL